ncbi:hypothetical protein DEO72_LG2g1547 [Vigna unguiculata]|uniref:Uncharacterized protein n=1 Tax=Vigna unguiculata TaxID=3917 RepID=A0A4D6KUX9_VIGUN|nr:hypothetical protein DEO72_LG2g1547 [Vigna unguiculata]
MSRLGENIRSSPWFLLDLSLRLRTFIFSDESSRSGEKFSLKRELVETCCALCSSCRLGEGLQFWAKSNLAQVRRSRLGENSQNTHYATIKVLAQARIPSFSERVFDRLGEGF